MSQNKLHCIVIDVTSFIAVIKMILEGLRWHATR